MQITPFNPAHLRSTFSHTPSNQAPPAPKLAGDPAGSVTPTRSPSLQRMERFEIGVRSGQLCLKERCAKSLWPASFTPHQTHPCASAAHGT